MARKRVNDFAFGDDAQDGIALCRDKRRDVLFPQPSRRILDRRVGSDGFDVGSLLIQDGLDAHDVTSFFDGGWKFALGRNRRDGGGAPLAPAQRSDGGYRRFAVFDVGVGVGVGVFPGMAPESAVSRKSALNKVAPVPISGFRNGGAKGRIWVLYHDKALRVPLEKEDA